MKAGGKGLRWTPWDNCSYPAILDYPDSNFPEGGWTIFLAALTLVVSCIFLARIVDHYFLAAVKNISDRWGLQGDVLNAVVYASAASWPELVISVITVFDTNQASVGIGTIVGTSVFNTLAVPAICSFVMTKGSWVDPVRTSRDTAMAAISLLLLGLVLKNHHVSWMNAAIMLSLYIVYIFGKFHIPLYVVVEKPSPENGTNSAMNLGEDEHSRDEGKCWAALKTLFGLMGPTILWPFQALLRILIPPAEKYPYLVVFVSMIYIIVITYVVAWMITILGYKLNIPNSLLSLTILSVGLGLPDLMSSLKTAKEGTASEALSNALGANTFNILVCLGLPWFVKAVVDPDDQNGILLNLDGVLYSVNIMFSALLMFYAALIANRFVFNATVGMVCIGIYCFFVVTMSLVELNVFFFVNNPLCDIKDFYSDPS